MIVCSCNVVSSGQIKAVVDELVRDDPGILLTPGMIYRHIGIRPKCGNCLMHVVEIVHEHRETTSNGITPNAGRRQGNGT